MSDGHGAKLPRKQEAALAALLTEATLGGAATKAGVSNATLRRWMRAAPFAAAYRVARGEILSHASARLQAASTLAVDTLTSILREPGASPAARIAAARAVLEFGQKAYGLEDDLRAHDPDDVQVTSWADLVRIAREGIEQGK